MREKDYRLEQAGIAKIDKGLMQKGANRAINHDEQEADDMVSVVPTVHCSKYHIMQEHGDVRASEGRKR